MISKKYNLLLPIAGKAQRFIDQGYNMPKPLIMAKTKQVIDWALDSIDTNHCNLIFAVLPEPSKCRRLSGEAIPIPTCAAGCFHGTRGSRTN